MAIRLNGDAPSNDPVSQEQALSSLRASLSQAAPASTPVAASQAGMTQSQVSIPPAGAVVRPTAPQGGAVPYQQTVPHQTVPTGQPSYVQQPISQPSGGQPGISPTAQPGNSGQVSTPVTLRQGQGYNPASAQERNQQAQQSNPAGGVRAGIRNQNNQQNPPTQGSGDNPPQDGGDENPGKGIKLGKNGVFIIAGICLVLVIAYVVISHRSPKVDVGETTTGEVDDSGFEWITPQQQVFSYTADQKERLRTAGYTGSEIEGFELTQSDVDQLVKQAEDMRAVWAQEVVAPLFDTASDEYKATINNTWYSLPQRTDMYDFSQIASYYSQTKNLDYEKVPVYGEQLFIKIFLDDDAHEEYVFVCVTPDQWLLLHDAGNVVVSYEYATPLIDDGTGTGGLVEDTTRMFITKVNIDSILY